MMTLSEIVWWLGAFTLATYLMTATYIMAGIAIRYYRRRK